MFDYSKVPVAYMADGMQRYIEQGIPPGSFLYSLLTNNLRHTVENADATNIHCIVAWVQWLYDEAPHSSWGSVENVEAWIERRGLMGDEQ